MVPKPVDSNGWIEWWNDAIFLTTSMLRVMEVTIAKICKHSSNYLKDEYAYASIQLEANPWITQLQQHVVVVQHELRKFELYEAKGA